MEICLYQQGFVLLRCCKSITKSVPQSNTSWLGWVRANVGPLLGICSPCLCGVSTGISFSFLVRSMLNRPWSPSVRDHSDRRFSKNVLIGGFIFLQLSTRVQQRPLEPIAVVGLSMIAPILCGFSFSFTSATLSLSNRDSSTQHTAHIPALLPKPRGRA